MDELTKSTGEKQMIHVYSADATDLEGLRSTVTKSDGEVGPVAEVPRGAMLHFDPALKQEIYFKVLGVLVTTGLSKLIEWASDALKKKGPGDPPIIVQVGKRKVELTAGTDPKVVRAVLDDLLKRA